MKIQSIAFAGLVGILGFVSAGASFADAKLQTVAAINQNKDKLAGKAVKAQGKVVKVNNGILDRNFIHVQDGTGAAGTNNLVVTSKQTATVGDEVVISGKAVVNKDFGSGYTYPLLIEDATITPKK